MKNQNRERLYAICTAALDSYLRQHPKQPAEKGMVDAMTLDAMEFLVLEIKDCAERARLWSGIKYLLSEVSADAAIKGKVTLEPLGR